MPFENEHSCRIEDPDEYDEFTRDDAAATVAGRQVDHVYGITDADVGELQSVRYPFPEWDSEDAMLDAMQDCESRGGIEFEPAESFIETSTVPGCVACGDRDHDTMTNPTTKQTTVEADGVVEREIKGEEREVLRVPISSTGVDREGDEFERSALDKMADQISEQQPLVFDNHGLAGGFMEAIPYDSRETIGTQFDAEVETAKDGDEGAELFAFVNPDGTHPEGERMLKQVRDEAQSIKFSVGFRITGYEEKEDDEGNVIGRIFTDADLMETSRVGIPANPDASVTASAVKGGAPGTQHPMMQLLAAQMGGVDGMEAKADGGQPEPEGDEVTPHDALQVLNNAELNDAQSARLAAIAESDGWEVHPSVTDEADEPEGKDDTDPNEDLSADVDELRSTIADLKDSLEDGKVGDSKTEDPTEAGTTPDETDNYEGPDETDESEPEETSDTEAADSDGSNYITDL